MATIGDISFTTNDLAERKTEAANKLAEVKADLELDPTNPWLLEHHSRSTAEFPGIIK